MENQQKIALVTVGTKGIGKAIADRLTIAGIKVIVSARSNAADNPHDFIAADLSKTGNVAQLVAEIGHIDILVNNMGANTLPGGGFSTFTDAHWDEALRVNLLAAVRMDRALLPGMLVQKSGVIIYISSTSGMFPIWEATMA